MLVLNRKAGQKIVIGDSDVIITFLGYNGAGVRIGFEADPKFLIHREEVFKKIKLEKFLEEELNNENN